MHFSGVANILTEEAGISDLQVIQVSCTAMQTAGVRSWTRF